MTEILTDVFSMIKLRNLRSNDNLSKKQIQDIAHTLENLVLCDRLLVERTRADEYGIFAEFKSLRECLKGIEAPSDFHRNYGESYQSLRDVTSRFHARTIDYVNLSTELEVYLCLDPSRHPGLQELASLDGPTAHEVVQRFHRKLASGDAGTLARIKVDAPPVLQAVLQKHSSGTDLISAVLELRNSKNAERFRAACKKLDDTIKKIGPEAALKPAQDLRNELNEVSTQWEFDLDEGVRYVKRTLNFGKIWGLGPFLEFFGLEKFSIRDPVISSRKPHLLFLNDLYRP